MSVIVSALAGEPIEAAPVEVVECKGLGHPDTICDALAEEASRALSRQHLERFGFVLHHNVDKVLLRGGAARAVLGGGEVLEPIEIYLAGQATREYRGARVPVEELVLEACSRWLRERLHALDVERHVRLHCLVRPGSADLVELFERQRRSGRPLANDTSIGSGHAPASGSSSPSRARSSTATFAISPTTSPSARAPASSCARRSAARRASP